MKKETKAIHEFLADQFAVTENTKWQYAELLLMQAFNTNQRLVNPFFHNQIKRRIAMITTSKKPSYQYLRKLMVFPVAAIVIGLFAFSYRSKETKGINSNSGDAFLLTDTIPQTNDPASVSGNVMISMGEPVETATPSKIIINGKEITVNKITLEGFDSAKIINAELHINTEVGKKDSPFKGLFVLDGVKLNGSSMEEILNKVNPADIELINVLKGPPAVLKYGDDGKNGVIEIMTKKNENPEEIKKSWLKNADMTNTTKPAPDTTIWTKKTFSSPQKKSPSQEQLNVWQDAKMYGVWFDSRRIKNSELTKHKPSDFVLYNVSKLEKNATNYGKHYYQVTLTSANQYAKSFPGDSQTYYMKHVKKADTTKPINIIQGKVLDKVETEASFPGGDQKWHQYVEYNMGKGNFNLNKTAPEGTYTTVIQFIVDIVGNISDVKALTDHGYGMEEEAIRMMKNSPKWNPAVQNGHPVKAYYRQPITFVVRKDQKNSLSNATTTGGEESKWRIFEQVEIEAAFPGGESKWRQYLERNLDASVPIKKKAPDGAYTVIVQFIVDKEGNISDIKSLTKHGYGMEEEAKRVIKLGPRWVPAIQNGQQVRAYRKQPITFMVGKGQKNFPAVVKTNSNELNEVVVVPLSAQNTNNIVFDKVEIPPSFPGGAPAWKKYLERNANGLVATDSGAPAGVYKVMVQFIVHEDGSLSDVKALTHHGYGMEKESMRVIKSGPKWIPAKQNGHIVAAYVQQPITFAITDEPEDKPDTAKLKNTLLVIDGKIIGKMKDNMRNPGLMNFLHANMLDEKTARQKYGEQGKNGAWEVYTSKSNFEDYKNDTARAGVSTAYKIFDKTEIPPSFPGGDPEWRKYLIKNINATLPVTNGAPAGVYKTYVLFTVKEDGSLDNIRSNTNYGYGIEQEAQRIIKEGPKWVPARQNGHIVRASAWQPVTFEITEEDGKPKQNSLPTTIATGKSLKIKNQ